MRLELAALVAAMAVGCNEQTFFTRTEIGPEVSPGEIQGRVCDPTGRTWLADATVYTHLVDVNDKLYDTRIAYSDPNGYWLLEDLPGDRDYTIYVQSGDDLLSQETVTVGDGEHVTLEEPDCFDPLLLDVAVITGDYDDFQIVLSNMGFANYKLVDGLTATDVTDFLSNLDDLLQYDIVFFNGGFVEDGVLYEKEGESTGVPATIISNLETFVAAGGSVYASDWAYDVVEEAWPERIDWVGDDSVPDAAQLGEYQVVNAAVSDAALSEWLGTTHVEVEFDLPVWPPIQSVDLAVSTHLSGDVTYREGTDTYNLAAVPLLVSFTSGEGKVAFSTFRVAKNASSDVVLTLQYMMYNL